VLFRRFSYPSYHRVFAGIRRLVEQWFYVLGTPSIRGNPAIKRNTGRATNLGENGTRIRTYVEATASCVRFSPMCTKKGATDASPVETLAQLQGGDAKVLRHSSDRWGVQNSAVLLKEAYLVGSFDSPPSFFPPRCEITVSASLGCVHIGLISRLCVPLPPTNRGQPSVRTDRCLRRPNVYSSSTQELTIRDVPQ